MSSGLQEERGKEEIMDERVKQLADIIYGENGGEDFDTMVMTGSSVLNREAAGKPQEFGSDLAEVGQKGYYAVSNNSDMFQQAQTGNFPDEKSSTAYKRCVQAAYGLETGTIKKHSSQFSFTPVEEKRMRKAGKKVFDFDKVVSTGKVGKYNTYAYPK